MIRKLRIKFVVLSMLALLILLFVIVAGVNILNYKAVIEEADYTLAVLADNRGDFPDFDDNSRPPKMFPEAPEESRHFSVLTGENGDVLQTDTWKMKTVDKEAAIEYAEMVMSENEESGFIDGYRFLCHMEGNGTWITFLDCQSKLQAFQIFLLISIGMAFAGYCAFFFVILFFSGRIIRPVAESYEKQKRFITDAGHEIKTPLTIIKADADVLEMELEENEWLADIQKQVKRLAALTTDLVYLSRMEEENNSMQMIEFPFSDVVSEAASSFQALARTQGKNVQCRIQPMLSLKGNEKAIHQLVCILLDNALKYSPNNGTISLGLERQNKTIQLSVYNTTENPVPKENLNQFFDRFYRMDASRNSQTGGYGIGLSIAKAITAAHSGRIQAKTGDGQSLEITISFPFSAKSAV